MAVKRVRYKKRRAGTRFETQSGFYIGWRVDYYQDGKRIRNKCFASKAEAEKFIGQKLNNLLMSEDELLEVFLQIRAKQIGFSRFKEIWQKYK
jgi:hypothetical protein